MRARDRTAIVAIGVATLGLRLCHLRGRPLFNDEAIFIRWAQLIRTTPSRLFEITLRDPKPPLHPALLALFVRLGSDPVLAGRAISAVIGALTVLAFAAVAYELERRSDFAIIAAALAASSPFLAFHQRLATADALFVLESLLAVWLTLRGPSLLAGTALGAALETRSVFSVALLAVVFLKRRKGFAVAAVVAACLWLPFLLASRGWYGPSAGAELRRRVLYQSQFHAAMPSFEAFNWLWSYLTPPVAIAAFIGLAALLYHRDWFLGVWTAAMLLPVIFGSVTYSRYAVNTAVPLLLAAAWVIAKTRWPLAACALAVAFPLFLTIRGAADWRQEHLLARDRYQYDTGWPAGFATEGAAAWLARRAAEQPIAVVTSDEWGVPADGIWIWFDRNPRVRMFFTSRSELLTSDLRNVRIEKWGSEQPAKESPPNVPVYGVTRATIGETLPAGAIVFRNPDRSPDAVIVLPLQPGHSSR
jgi:hypothetical protein